MIDTRRFVKSVCMVIESLSRAELTKQGYKLVVNYLEESADLGFSGCARYTVKKYISKDLPTLEDIRARHKTGAGISELDDLVLRMEYEASQLEKHRERF
ncbi:MAG: hypothetical protein JXB03_00375 [Spirochaetales bacterium]|nr:hypothetical protein [Spirochaetales bacterium]